MVVGGCGSHLTPGPGGGGGTSATGGFAAIDGGAGRAAGGTGNGAGTPTGGTGGAGARDAGPAAPVNVCLGAFSELPSLGYTAYFAPYDGPAVVERSTTDELILENPYTLAGGAGGSGSTDAGGAVSTSENHTRFFGITPMPLFPVGAQVWLTMSVVQVRGLEADLQSTFSFAVRAGQAGRLLFGAATASYGPLSFPVPVDQLTTTCTANGVYQCAPQGTVTYASAVVTGDVPVVVQTDHLTTISLDGSPYDVRLDAETGTSGGYRCSDWSVPEHVSIDVRAQGLASLIAGLPVGPPPACGKGNDLDHAVRFDVYGLVGGVVSYVGPDARQPNTDDFVGPPAADGSSQGSVNVVNLNARHDLPTYSAGQRLWLSTQTVAADGGLSRGTVTALRESEGGPIVLARYSQTAPLAPGPLGPLADLLGISVTTQKSCDYAAAIAPASGLQATALMDVTFGTSPPLRVPGGTIGTFTLGGRTYHAWVHGIVSEVTIYRAQ
jgi:hypothetical protein